MKQPAYLLRAIPEKLHKQIALAARLEGCSMRDWILAACEIRLSGMNFNDEFDKLMEVR